LVIKVIPLTKVDPPSFMSRVIIPDQQIDELAVDISKRGLIHLPTVRPKGDRYEIVAGHARLLALKKLGWKKAKFHVRELTDKQAKLLSISETLKRRDFDAMTLALKIQELRTKDRLTLDQVANEVGMPRGTVSNLCRLLDLPETVQALVATGQLDWTKALELLRLPKPRYQEIIAQKVVNEGATVLATRAMVQKQLDFIRKAQAETKTPTSEKVPPSPTPEPAKVPCPICGTNYPRTELLAYIMCPECYGRARRTAIY